MSLPCFGSQFIVQVSSHQSDGVGTTNVIPMTPTVGNNIYCAFGEGPTVAAVSGVTGEGGNGWNLCPNSNNSTNRGTEIWYNTNVDQSSTTITVTRNVSGETARDTCYEVSGGLASGNPCDVAGTNSGTSASPATAGVTTTDPLDLCIGIVVSANNGGLVSGPTNSFTAQMTPSSSLQNNATKIETATQASESTGWTFTNSVAWGSSIACMLSAATANAVHSLILQNGKVTIQGKTTIQ